MSDDAASWLPGRFKGTEVLVRADAAGRPAADPHGLVEMVYREGGRVYRASLRNLEIADDAQVVRSAEPTRPTTTGPLPRPQPAGVSLAARPAVRAPSPAVGSTDRATAWTDGACRGNPGPAGAGVLLRWEGRSREISRYLGQGTNNIGELTAIRLALEAVPEAQRAGLDLTVYTDSAYSLGVLTKPWKPKKNMELIAEIKQLMAEFRKVRILKVAGHAGIPENERVDQLAVLAVETRQSFDQELPPAASG